MAGLIRVGEDVNEEDEVGEDVVVVVVVLLLLKFVELEAVELLFEGTEPPAFAAAAAAAFRDVFVNIIGVPWI